MIENDLHTQELTSQAIKRNPTSVKWNSVFATFFNTVRLLFDALQFLLSPGEMARRIEQEFDQQIYRRDDK
jgi:hypothetical protein